MVDLDENFQKMFNMLPLLRKIVLQYHLKIKFKRYLTQTHFFLNQKVKMIHMNGIYSEFIII
jgi:hypothetical protein